VQGASLELYQPELLLALTCWSTGTHCSLRPGTLCCRKISTLKYFQNVSFLVQNIYFVKPFEMMNRCLKWEREIPGMVLISAGARRQEQLLLAEAPSSFW